MYTSNGSPVYFALKPMYLYFLFNQTDNLSVYYNIMTCARNEYVDILKFS